MKTGFKIAMLGIGASLLAAPALATDSNNANEVTIVSVDYKGKPPFKRSFETVPMADVAALEAAESASQTIKVTTVDFSGKPPFRRNVEQLTVVDTAALEPAREQSRTSFRGKPPFKR